MELGLEVDESRRPHTVLRVSGEIDVYTAPQLRERLVTLIMEGDHRVIIDLENVGFMDSTGLGVLVGALKRARSNDGEISIVCTQRRLRKVFEITGLDTVFPMYTDVDLATSGE